jgi:formylmethanofuran dehydrogenase subunit E
MTSGMLTMRWWQLGGLGLGLILAADCLVADDKNHAGTMPSAPALGTGSTHVQAKPGYNAWNTGRAPADWWGEIQRQHGHVGPWNVLGWRIGQAALCEFGSSWGRHELELICYVPLQTPYTCLVDGVAVGTGNSPGRLDLRMAEVFDYRQVHVAVRRKDGTGGIVEFWPVPAYLKSILNQPLEALERLSRDCAQRAEQDLFSVRRLPASD